VRSAQLLCAGNRSSNKARLKGRTIRFIDAWTGHCNRILPGFTENCAGSGGEGEDGRFERPGNAVAQAQRARPASRANKCSVAERRPGGANSSKSQEAFSWVPPSKN